MNHPRLLIILLVPIVSFAVTACGGTDDSGGAAAAASGDRATVTIEAFTFDPDPLEVPVGTVITFVNDDKIDHTVTAGTREAPTPEIFDGQLPEQGATFELVLDEPGTYEYFCEIHPGPGMTGTITVADGPSAEGAHHVFDDMFADDHHGHEAG